MLQFSFHMAQFYLVKELYLVRFTIVVQLIRQQMLQIQRVIIGVFNHNIISQERLLRWIILFTLYSIYTFLYNLVLSSSSFVPF